jgi:hypothetical protein
MKRLVWGTTVALFVFLALPIPTATNPVAQARECARIKDGTITDNAGNPIKLGYDEFGYNYQARIFNGTYDTSDRVADGKYFGATVDYADDSLIMKWSDDWLSNQDCNGDNKLDRGPAGTSQGWLTNQVEGDYVNGDDLSHYTLFTKIVYDPNCSTSLNGCLWGTYTVIEDVYNDPDGGYHGVDRSRLAHPAGFGAYK